MYSSTAELQQALTNDLSRYIDTSLPGWSVDSSLCEVRCFILRDTLLKKFMSEERPTPAQCDTALKKFLAVNAKCSEWTFAPTNSGEEEMLNGVRDAIYDFWFANQEPVISDFDQIFRSGKVGPGASISALGTDFYTKLFDSPLSSTKGLHETWIQCASKYDLWAEALCHSSRRYPATVVESSNYSFVNKNVTVARGICTEPTINMWFQLGVGSLIERRLARQWGIDIRGAGSNCPQQDINRRLACAGSLHGELSTLDMESASDSVGLKMLKWLLPRTAFSILDTLRCPRTKLPDGRHVDLHMVSTMGNGFTFPLETLVFAAVVIAVCRYSGVPVKLFGDADDRNVAVYGDDIICPTTVVHRVERVLDLLGFTVNRDKSFVEGAFRESCGADFLYGENVRGVYIKRLDTLQHLFIAINRLNRWSAISGVELPETVGVLLQHIRHPRRFVVPFDENDDAGLKLPDDLSLSPLRNWDTGVRMREYRAHVVVSSEIFTEPCLEHVIRMKRGEYHVKRGNPYGMLLANLVGSMSDYRISIRQREVRYTTKRRFTPRWSYLPSQPFEGLIGPDRSRRFAIAAARNVLRCGWWNP